MPGLRIKIRGKHMKFKRLIFLLAVLFFITSFPGFPDVQPEEIKSKTRKLLNPINKLKLLTINVWSGLNYKGFFKVGEHETKQIREKRFRSLVSQIKELDPDIIFLQEVNPVRKYSRKLAKKLGYTEIHQVCLGGIKFGPVGIPSNLKEGNAILAKQFLKLKKYGVKKLSGGFGLYGDVITFHFNESIFALIGKVMIGKTPVYLVNIHLNADSKARRIKEIQNLLKFLKTIPNGSPVILGGDLNGEPDSNELDLLKKGNPSNNFIDTFISSKGSKIYTLDPVLNKNVGIPIKASSEVSSKTGGNDLLSDIYQKGRKRIDYILLNQAFSKTDVIDYIITIDKEINCIQASDHYGVYTEIDVRKMKNNSPIESDEIIPSEKSKIEVFPILMYDTDIGFGYGMKAFYFNPFKKNESFDLTLFNSSKGERWYRLFFSWPDIERRQGKKYPLAVDLLIDYDKKIRNSFFGTGEGSEFSDREFYSKEPLELNLAISRGFTPNLIGQAGLKFRSIKNYNLSDDGHLINLEPALNRSIAKYTSFFGNLRYDTRNSFINPSKGVVIKGESEFSLSSKLSNVSFTRASLNLQTYYELFYPGAILAARVQLQNLCGEDLPVQLLLPIGGNRTLRGYPQDRFLGKTSAVINAEIRFPLFSNLGGVVGFDSGKVWDSLNELDLKKWAVNSVIGLRYYMKNFVVRVDIGLGKGYTGFYFNFGHIF